MALSPIERLIDAGLKCVRCGARRGACHCWDKNVELFCPNCERTMMVCRDETDPPGTTRVEATCDRCDDGGGFPETRYYDAQGWWFNGERFVPQPD